MMARITTFAAAACVAGCAATPVCEPVAPRVVTRTEVVEVPVAAPRTAPPELLEPLRARRPALSPLGEYCLTYASWLDLLAALGELEHHYLVCRAFAASPE